MFAGRSTGGTWQREDGHSQLRYQGKELGLCGGPQLCKYTLSPPDDCPTCLEVRASALSAGGPRFQSRLSSTNDLKTDSLVAALPYDWCYGDIASTERPSVSLPWRSEIASVGSRSWLQAGCIPLWRTLRPAGISKPQAPKPGQSPTAICSY